MRLFGNILWFVFSGWYLALTWLIAALFFAVLILGLPLAKASFQMAKMSAFPFGKEVIHVREIDNQGLTLITSITGTIGFIFNILWFLTFGWVLFIMNLIAGLSSCIAGCIISVFSLLILAPIGAILIAFGIQSFKLASISLWPVGRRVVSKEVAQVARQRTAENYIDTMSGSVPVVKKVMNKNVSMPLKNKQPIQKEVFEENKNGTSIFSQSYLIFLLNYKLNKIFNKLKSALLYIFIKLFYRFL